MKRLLVGASLCAATALAFAQSELSVNQTGTGTVTGDFSVSPLTGLTTDLDGATAQFGTLATSGPATITYTYLGAEAGLSNFFATDTGYFANQGPEGGSASTVGATLTQKVFDTGSTNLDFSFGTLVPTGDSVVLSNSDGNTSPDASYAIVAGDGIQTTQGSFQYILHFDDPGMNVNGDSDFDDLLVGVNISPIPEPETYALLLAGLGMMGYMARRRRAE